MSSQPDYNFNQPAPSNSESASLQLPFALLSTAIAILMVAQTWGTFEARGKLHEGELQLADAYRNREGAVKQSGELQQKLSSIASDLLLLAQTDADAKAIANKYFQQPAGGSAPAAAPAAEPAK